MNDALFFLFHLIASLFLGECWMQKMYRCYYVVCTENYIFLSFFKYILIYDDNKFMIACYHA